jgi:ATP-dependent helicase/DNAse subunit B
MNETIGGVISDITGRMTSGEIDAIPLKKGGKTSACKWCEYKPFCRNAKI